MVDELGTLLVEAGMQNVLPLPKARVPVVKFVVPDNGTKARAHAPRPTCPPALLLLPADLASLWACYPQQAGGPVMHSCLPGAVQG